MTEINAAYVDHMGDDLSVVNAARVSYNKGTLKFTEKDIKLLNYLAKHQHFSPFEHTSMTMLIECPLYIRSQIHRHRTLAFNEISRRYTAENIEFFIPKSFRKQHTTSKQCSDGDVEKEAALTASVLMQKIHDATLVAYNKLLQIGVAREQARAILPQSLMTKFYMTGNLRSWAHFIKLRIDSHAQEEAQEVARQCKEILTARFPHSMDALMKGDI